MNAVPTLSPEHLLRFDAAVPRYTSYPSAAAWGPLPDTVWAGALSSVQGPASVYVHVPFCREQCWFCGCNQVVAGRADAGDRYLDALTRQLATLPLPDVTPTVRVHLGGGTPTWLRPDQLHRLLDLVDARFPRAGDAELSVEIDPEVTTEAHLDALRARGLTRVSLGVQSFDPAVLAAIGRPQDPDRVTEVVQWARAAGLRGLNLDLVYGLPGQDLRSLDDTLDRTLALAPDRLALYGFAWIPQLKRHQRRLDPAALPAPLHRAALLLHAHRRLAGAGLVPIGMDHFARPDDDLALALGDGRLQRNFMGYTTRAGADLVGLGMSAISEHDGLLVQQRAALAPWYRAVAGDEPIVEKGWVLSADDRLRRDAIHALMCQGRLDLSDLARLHGDAAWALRASLDRLDDLQRDGLVVRDADTATLTPTGRLLSRTVARVFDAYTSGAHSRAV